MARHPARSAPHRTPVLGTERSEIAKGRSLCPKGSAGGRWQLKEFQQVPGIGVVGAHVFSAIIEDPSRFTQRGQLIRYARLAITQQSSDGKPLGYQRLDRSGHRELKTLSYHAWRTATKSTTKPNAVQSYYHASRERTHDVRHARLNTQRKLLEALWQMWRRRERYRPEKFFPAPGPPARAGAPSATAPPSG